MMQDYFKKIKKVMMEKEEGFWSFFWIAVKVRFFNLADFSKTAFYYYRNFKFAKVDFELLVSYFFLSPYRLSRAWAKKSGFEASEIYGETPLITLALIAKEAQISESDIVYELGSGRGRSCFWLKYFIGCTVYGIECNPVFVQKANSIKERFQIKELYFLQEDLTKADLSNATVVYLYVITLSDEDIKGLTKHLKKLKKGARIITISFPLVGCEFHVEKEFDVAFAWGVASAYLHKVQ